MSKNVVRILRLQSNLTKPDMDIDYQTKYGVGSGPNIIWMSLVVNINFGRYEHNLQY